MRALSGTGLEDFGRFLRGGGGYGSHDCRHMDALLGAIISMNRKTLSM